MFTLSCPLFLHSDCMKTQFVYFIYYSFIYYYYIFDPIAGLNTNQGKHLLNKLEPNTR